MHTFLKLHMNLNMNFECGFTWCGFRMGVHGMLVLVACCCLSVLVSAGDHVVLNPLQRALFELRDAYAQPDDGDLCGGSAAINAECAVCEALGDSPGRSHIYNALL